MTRSALGWVVVCLLAPACANNVSQDRSTGPDGKVKGALPIVLTENEGKANGIVTYPGGDRVDWKAITLPAGKKGRLDVQLTYSTPRPGLKVSFDLFDQWNVPVTEAVVSGKGRVKSATVDKARGTYFVRIYAPRRGDAGQYKLAAAFHEELPPAIFNPLNLAIHDPPKLPDVPPLPSTCEVWNPKDPACKGCPASAPADWKGCAPPTATPPAPPTPPMPPPLPPAKPVMARVIKVDVAGDSLEVVVGGGSEQGIAKDWKVTVLRGDTTSPLSGGAGTVVRVNKTTTVIRVKLTSQQINANSNVQLSP